MDNSSVQIQYNDFYYLKCNFKKGIGIESQNLYVNKLEIKTYGMKLKMDLKSRYRTKINSKAFVIPILTATL